MCALKQKTGMMEEQTLMQDLMELASHMRQERLFTQYELNNLQTLNEQVNLLLGNTFVDSPGNQ